MSLKDLPNSEKPREKLIRYGVESLSNIELLTIIIGSGTKNNSAMDVAYNLIKDKGLLSIIDKPYEEFMQVNGINKVKALTLASIFELYKRLPALKLDQEEYIVDSDSIYLRYKDKLSGFNQEVLGIVVLDKHKKIINEKVIYKGTKDHVNFSMIDILRNLMINKAYYFYIYHNHPDGSLEPSVNDIAFTSSLIVEARKYKYKFLDHLIIGESGYYSFAKGDPKNS